MASDESFTNYVAEQQRHIQRFSCRKMFDEYATCSGDKAIALICENQMFVLPTAGGRAVLGAPRLGPPSPGATPHVLIGGELEDAELMARLIAATAADIEARQFVDEGQADGERRKGKPDKPGQGEAAVVMHDLLHRIRPMRSLIVALALAAVSVGRSAEGAPKRRIAVDEGDIPLPSGVRSVRPLRKETTVFVSPGPRAPRARRRPARRRASPRSPRPRPRRRTVPGRRAGAGAGR